MSGYLKYFIERPLPRGRDDPLLEWRLHTHSLRFEPLHPGHARNLPETIHRSIAADVLAAEQAEALLDSGRRDDAVRHLTVRDRHQAEARVELACGT
jgi:hypothetical protein